MKRELSHTLLSLLLVAIVLATATAATRAAAAAVSAAVSAAFLVFVFVAVVVVMLLLLLLLLIFIFSFHVVKRHSRHAEASRFFAVWRRSSPKNSQHTVTFITRLISRPGLATSCFTPSLWCAA